MSSVVTSECVRELPFARHQLWRVLSKTDWLNRALGLPAVTYETTPLPEGGSRVMAKANFLGSELRWEELPFEWVEDEFYRVRRKFVSGPLLEANVGMDFTETANGRSRVRAWSELTPRHTMGAMVAKMAIGPKASRDMEAVIDHLEKHLAGRERVMLPNLPKAAIAESPLQAGFEQLLKSGQPEALVAKLESLLRESSDVEICRIRPFALARDWGCDRWEVLRLCLQATRCGLLDLSWEVLCPNCRSSRQPHTARLADLQQGMHCDVCQIRYDGEFDKSVELKFVVNHSLRPCDAQTFCLAGPGGKPHIVSQLYLQPDETREWRLAHVKGAYRLRSPQVKESTTVTFDRTTTPAQIECAPGGFKGIDGALAGAVLSFRNPNAYPVQVMLEKLAWDDTILTAAQATNWQEFRDLFTREVISPNEQITVGQQVIIFTDLKGSTAMYCDIGDSCAYVLVRDHFEVLTEAIRQHRGGIVKTIGDAVMAVFSQPADALEAVCAMQAGMAKLTPKVKGAPPLKLKAALHLGPCLAVNANDKLDYFGTTINLAARLVDRSQGEDVVVSDDFYRRPEFQQFLTAKQRSAEATEVTFRGFNAPQKVWRIEVV